MSRMSFGLALIGLILAAGPAPAQTIITIGSGFDQPQGVAVDSAGDVFVADAGNGAVKQILASSRLTSTFTVGGGFTRPTAIGFDPAGNLFVADGATGNIYEVPAAGAYTGSKLLRGGFVQPTGIAADANDNVFVADANGISEALSSDGYITVKTIGSGGYRSAGLFMDGQANLYAAQWVQQPAPPNQPVTTPGVLKIQAQGGYVATQMIGLGSGFVRLAGVWVDSGGNMFVADAGQPSAVKELLAAGGYSTIRTLGADYGSAQGVAVDGTGNIYIADQGTNAVKEILATSPPLVASVLPGGRSVLLGNPATIFATMVNTGAGTFDGCQVALMPQAPENLTLSYQTTDPATNAPTGTPNTPVSIPGGAPQSFLLVFSGTTAFSAPGMPLAFSCAGAAPATIIPGVDTVDLAMSPNPVPDIVALVATVGNTGIVQVGSGGGAFAVASVNLGSSAAITVSVDTGAASLGVAPAICETNPGSGQCLAAPAASVSLTIAQNATPTFAVFVPASSQPIALAPASSRVFVRFKDAGGAARGSTSVAVESAP